MALGILTWDLPSEEGMAKYNEEARSNWIPSVLSQPGVKEFRAYRNPHHTSPNVMTHVEFENRTAWLKWIVSENYATIMAGLRGAGCTNIHAEVWGASPIVPEPLNTPSG